jgi:hypothetical protein
MLPFASLAPLVAIMVHNGLLFWSKLTLIPTQAVDFTYQASMEKRRIVADIRRANEALGTRKSSPQDVLPEDLENYVSHARKSHIRRFQHGTDIPYELYLGVKHKGTPNSPQKVMSYTMLYVPIEVHAIQWSQDHPGSGLVQSHHQMFKDRAVALAERIMEATSVSVDGQTVLGKPARFVSDDEDLRREITGAWWEMGVREASWVVVRATEGERLYAENVWPGYSRRVEEIVDSPMEGVEYTA